MGSVCNAGISGPKGDPSSSDAKELRDTLWNNESVEEWGDTYRTDVTSVYFTTVAFLPLLQAAIEPQGPRNKFGSSVITISSMSGIMRHAQGHFSYNAAKGATVHLTKMMSAEFQKCWIRVNSIAPGYFPSEMTTKTSDDNQKSSLDADKVAEKGHVPAMRGGKEVEMGMAVVSSSEAAIPFKQAFANHNTAVPGKERVCERRDYCSRRWSSQLACWPIEWLYLDAWSTSDGVAISTLAACRG